MNESEYGAVGPDSVGVVVGRFQIDNLHPGHINLLNRVTNLHGRNTIVFVGRGSDPQKYQLDFETVKRMILSRFPAVTVASIYDRNNSELWSRDLDELIESFFPNKRAVLYGGRDSFLEEYKGRFEKVTISAFGSFSSTDRRSEIVRAGSQDDALFRRGVIYGVASLPASMIPYFLLAVTRNGSSEVVLVRETSSHNWGLPAERLDPEKDTDDRAALRRILIGRVAVDVSIEDPLYITSAVWRLREYRKSRNSAFATLFAAGLKQGEFCGIRESECCRWFPVDDIERVIDDSQRHFARVLRDWNWRWNR